MRGYLVRNLRKPLMTNNLRRPPAMLIFALAAIVAVSAAGLAGAPSWLALLAGIVVPSLIITFLENRALGKVKNLLGGEPTSAQDFPRLYNIVDGLCLTHGINQPELLVLKNKSINIAVAADRKESVLVITAGALDTLGLVELEGLLAHSLARCDETKLATQTREVFWCTFPLGGTSKVDEEQFLLTDQKGVALTRFPPGLAQALEQAGSVGSFIEGSSATANLWVLDPTAAMTASGHPSVELRSAVLGEL